MTQTEFNLLVTNLTAITSQTFAIQCGEFASTVSDEQDEKLVINKFDLDQYISQVDFQEILDGGYGSLDSLKLELDDAWNTIDQDNLRNLTTRLPTGLPEITIKITADHLKQWITYSLDAADDDPLYVLHKYVMGFFAVSFNEAGDIIREAIAFDELAGLHEHENTINAEDITVCDLITAATIQSLKVFEWMIKHSQLNDDQIAELFESVMDDMGIFEQIYKIIMPTTSQCKKIMLIAGSNNQDAVVQFLKQVKRN